MYQIMLCQESEGVVTLAVPGVRKLHANYTNSCQGNLVRVEEKSGKCQGSLIWSHFGYLELANVP